MAVNVSRLINEIKDVVIGLLPEKLKQIFERGLFKAFLVLIFVFVLLPPLIVLLAAFWLNLLGTVETTAIKSLRNAYLESIYEGFSIEAMASRSNVRLDYLQLFEYDLRPKNAPYKELIISILPGQKAAIEVRTVAFKVDNKVDKPNCSLPEGDIDLVSVSLGDVHIRTFKQESNRIIKITKSWWDTNLAQFDSSESEQRLLFKLSEPARHLPCGLIHIEGSISVFKDLLTTRKDSLTQ